MRDIKRIILSLSIFLISCAPFRPVPAGVIDPALYPYYVKYALDKSIYQKQNPVMIKNMDIVFYSTGPSVMANCLRTSDGYRKISIDPGIWFSLNHSEKILVFYHEMGHCDLDLPHSNTYTIMNPYATIIYGSFISNPGFYLDSLFNKGK